MNSDQPAPHKDYIKNPQAKQITVENSSNSIIGLIVDQMKAQNKESANSIKVLYANFQLQIFYLIS